mgnify:FL=1
MARPIRSVLARRHMFRGGGMIPVGNPMQNINQASGILASSQPLIEAVSQDATSPVGGASLSMAKGGIARFDNGGMYSFPIYGRGRDFQDKSIPSFLRPSRQLTLFQARTETDAERLMTMFPAEFAESITKPGGKKYTEEPSMARKIVGSIPGRVGTLLEKTIAGAEVVGNRVDSFLAQRFRGQKDLLGYLFSDKEEASGRSFSERRALTELISIRPDLEKEILSAGAGIIGQTNSANDFAKEIAKTLSIKFESGPVSQTAGVPEMSEEQGYTSETKLPPSELGSLSVGGSDISGEGYDPEVELYQEDLEKATLDYGRYLTADWIGGLNLGSSITPTETEINVLGTMGIQPVTQAQQFIIDLQKTKSPEFVNEVLQSADVQSPDTSDELKILAEKREKEWRDKNLASYGLTGPFGTRTPDDLLDPEQYEEDPLSVTKKSEDIPEGWGVAGEGLGFAPVTVKNIVNPEEGGVVVSQADLFSLLNKKKKNTSADAKVAAVDNLVSRIVGTASGEGTDRTIEDLKSDIEKALPALDEKDDDQMMGFLIAYLGANIAAGTSPDAMQNIAGGAVKSLPAIMNWKQKQTSDKRARQMTVAKIAIQQKLSLDAENRAERRTIRTEQREEERKRLRPTNYMTTKATKVPQNVFPGRKDAKGFVIIPEGMTISLDYYQKQSMNNLNVPVIEIGKPTPKFKDLLKQKGGEGVWDLPLEDLNKLFSPATAAPYAPWENYKSNYRPVYGYPKAGAFFKRDTKGKLLIPEVKYLMSGGEFKALTYEYGRVSRNYRDLYNKLDELHRIDPKKLVGTGTFKDRFGTMVAGIAGAFGEGSGLDDFKKWLLDGKDIGAVDAFSTKGRLLLAKLTPILLGESGRTISDADRVRVARALGFTVDAPIEDGKVVWRGITGFDQRVLANPAAITRALEETSRIIVESLDDIHSIYRGETAKVNFNVSGLRALRSNVPEYKKPKKLKLHWDLTKDKQNI